MTDEKLISEAMRILGRKGGSAKSGAKAAAARANAKKPRGPRKKKATASGTSE